MSLSNPAKLLKGYMDATGIFDTAELAAQFEIPVRTIQRLKLEIATCANSANCAIYGAANSATDGVGVRNNAIYGASDAAASRARIESPSGISSCEEVKEDSHPLPPQPVELVCESGLRLTADFIIGPGFKIDLAAVDQIAMLSCMDRTKARAVAEIHARDWAANGRPPQHPMALLKRHLQGDVNQADIAEARKAKATAPPDKPAETLSERVARLSAAASKSKDQCNGNTGTVHRAHDGSLLQAAS